MYKYLLIFLSIAMVGNAQIKKPTKWNVSSKVQMETKTAEVTFTATIDDGWYIYSNDFDPELGPTLTTISFEKNGDFEVFGKPKAIHPKKKYDDVFGGDITYFKSKGVFVQKIKFLKTPVTIKGNINYQTCTEKDGVCVPGDEPFELIINVGKAINSELKDKKDTIVQSSNPIKRIENVKKERIQKPVPEDTGMMKFVIAAFLAGMASIFMPCIYPIMPMTVSFFTKQKNGQAKAIFYGVCIMLIFAAVGLVTRALGADFLNFLSTHWIPNLIFFLIFIVFGFSLLGAFEIVLPHNAVNKIDRLSDRGGLVGIFFMALTLVVVSFSCTVPFVGSLLIASASGEIMKPIYGMLAFGLPFALVFSGLAMFPSVLKSLPKSGGWLNELKAVFGFLEFALALKFLSNIDLTYHFNIIHRNIYLAIWIVFAVVIGLYILGFMRLSKDNKVEKLSTLRVAFAALFFALAIYMLPGLRNKPLSLLSGILPPMPLNSTGSGPIEAGMRELPHGLYGFHEIDEALVLSKKTNKPILIDFTGYACANCRKMEENVWPDEAILPILKNEFIIASLYVDDKAALDEDKKYISAYDNKLKSTIGEKNADFEISQYNNNAQPYYLVIDANKRTLSGPISYAGKTEFLKFLEAGLARYKKEAR